MILFLLFKKKTKIWNEPLLGRDADALGGTSASRMRKCGKGIDGVNAMSPEVKQINLEKLNSVLMFTRSEPNWSGQHHFAEEVVGAEGGSSCTIINDGKIFFPLKPQKHWAWYRLFLSWTQFYFPTGSAAVVLKCDSPGWFVNLPFYSIYRRSLT